MEVNELLQFGLSNIATNRLLVLKGPMYLFINLAYSWVLAAFYNECNYSKYGQDLEIDLNLHLFFFF